MKKVVFIDIDGTLRNSKREVTKEVKRSVIEAGKRGVEVVLCSARSRKYTERVTKECGAGAWMIHSNGAEIYQRDTGEILQKTELPKQACKTLYEIANKHQIALEMFAEDKIVSMNQSIIEGDIKEELAEPIDVFLEKHSVVQCIISDKNFVLMQSLKDQIEAIPGAEVKNRAKSLLDDTIPPKGSIYYDVNAKEVSKGNAIKALCQHLGIEKEQTIAIGDSINDIEMFKAVEKGIAMGNALPIVKKQADEVIATNDQNGVALFLDTL